MSQAKRVLSSAQWFGLLDSVLMGAIDHLLEDTVLVEHYVSQLVNYQLTHKKRHVGIRGAWAENISLMIDFLIEPTADHFEAIHLDRGYIFAILANFETLTLDYERALVSSFRGGDTSATTAAHRRVGARRDILQTVQSVRVMHQAAVDLRNALISQYDGWMQATSVYDAQNHPLPSEAQDLYQGYQVAATRAVEHFNVDKGSFKSYLEVWVKKSRNGDHHFYGSAFTVPSGVGGQHHLGTPLDQIDESVTDERYPSAFDIVNGKNERERIRDLIVLVDPGGYAAQALEIGEE